MRNAIKIGLYGGTFSPPHAGHVRAAEAAIERFSLDMLLIMPAAIPPHKRISDDDMPLQRLQMARTAFESLCRCGRAAVSDLEISRSGISYTSDTLTQLADIYDIDGKIKLICGTDMFLTLDSWHSAETIFELADIVYVRRRKSMADDDEIRKKCEYYASVYGAQAESLDIEPFELSSTEIRSMISARGVAALIELGYIDERVGEYIRARGLYDAK